MENYDLYEDLDVVIFASIEIIDYNRIVTFNINSTEIKIEGELADKIYDAVEVRIKNLKERQRAEYDKSFVGDMEKILFKVRQ